MKKLFFIIFALIVSFGAIAQTRVTEVTPNGTVSEPSYVYIWGSTADTLTNADTLNYVIRVYGNEVYDFKIGLYSDFVSGTAGGTLIGYGSLDGVNYFSLADTITVDSLEADAFDTETLDYSDYLWPYLKFIYLQSGTAVTIPKVYIYAKKN